MSDGIPITTIEAAPGGAITKGWDKLYRFPVIYVLEDGRRIKATETARLLRDAKAKLAALPRSGQDPLAMSVILGENGELRATCVTLNLGRAKPRPPAPAPLPAPDSDDVEASTFQKRPAYRYIRKSDKLPTYAELGDEPFEKIEAKVKLFNPTGIGRWFIAAYDPETRIAWGVAELQCREVGSIGMEELVAYRGLMGLPVERDLGWTPRPLAEVLNG